ncbi:hypothetical protein BRC90_00175 [Halobacteriales archaeon QS_4_69_34]|nr:MAG: hypothetical protein BRC90_00175 [Halobacteriales archaeon QS_4_69_34]
MSGRSRRWLGRVESRRWPCYAAVIAFAPVALAYLWTHPFPALGGGLYLHMAETIAAHGYGLPVRIPHYTAGGLPFGYPPLMLYVAGALLDLGAPPLALARSLPVALVAAALVAYAVAAAALLDSRPQGAFAAVVVATSPPVLHLTLTAGGTVRAAALLFVSAGIYAVVRLFRTGSRTWLLAAAGLFGATLLTHPLYTVFFGTSSLVLYAGLDRTPTGLVRGAIVAVGGLLVAAPWWTSVAATHGIELFGRASATHGGLGYPGWYARFPEVTAPLVSPWPALAWLGAAHLLLDRRWILPAWFVAVGLLTGRDEFLALVGAMMAAAVLFEAIVPALKRTTEVSWALARAALGRAAFARAARLRSVGPRVGVVALLVLSTYGVASASTYAAGGGAGDDLPMFVRSADLGAMEWARTETGRNASFVVLGSVAEWFPLFAHRTNLVVPQGSEWDRRTGRARQIHLRAALSRCADAGCLTARFERTGLAPTHVYLPRAGYGVGAAERRWNSLRPSLRRSPNYTVVYESRAALVAQTSAGAPNGSRADARREARTPRPASRRARRAAHGWPHSPSTAAGGNRSDARSTRAAAAALDRR